jgi:hypothetical protein
VTSSRAAAISRIDREMEQIVAAIPDAGSDQLYVLLEHLEDLDKAYSWLLDHVPQGGTI